MSKQETENLEDIKTMVEQLNVMVPKDSAKVQIKQYGGGPDESQITATQRGYLRLGIEFMRAAFAPKNNPKSPNSVDLDLDYLFPEDSDILGNWFERVESFPQCDWPQKKNSLSNLILVLFFGILFILLLGCTAIGFYTIIAWLSPRIMGMLA